MLQQQLSRLGCGDAAAIAQQQVLPQLHLQQANLSAQCGLGDVQHAGGAGKAAQLGHADEVFELLEIHFL